MGSWMRRIGWSVVAQGASSITNFGLYAVMAWMLDASSFGRFTAIMAVYHVALALARAAVFEPYVASSAPGMGVGPAMRAGLRPTLFISAVATGLAAVVGFVVGSPTTSIALVVGSMVALLVQDGCRHLSWAVARPRLTVAFDLVWTVVFAGGLAITVIGSDLAFDLATGSSAMEPIVLALWALGGWLSALVGLATLRGVVVGGAVGVQDTAASSATGVDRTAGESAMEPKDGESSRSDAVQTMGRSQAIQSTAFNLLPLVMAVVVSPAAAAAVKAVLLPFTPILTIVAGTRLVTLPAMKQAVDVSRSAIDRIAVRIAGSGAAFALIGGCITVILLNVVPLGADGSALSYSRTVAWWGMAITAMSVVDKYLADALALGRRQVPVIPMRLAAIGMEWTVLISTAGLRPETEVAGAWTLALGLASLIWLVPTIVDRAEATPVGVVHPPGTA